MPERQSDSEFRAEFIARTKQARETAGYTQSQIAELLQIDQGRYKQYETRSLLPHSMVAKFCLATKIDEAWLFTGRRAAQPKRGASRRSVA